MGGSHRRWKSLLVSTFFLESSPLTGRYVAEISAQQLVKAFFVVCRDFVSFVTVSKTISRFIRAEQERTRARKIINSMGKRGSCCCSRLELLTRNSFIYHFPFLFCFFCSRINRPLIARLMSDIVYPEKKLKKRLSDSSLAAEVDHETLLEAR